MNTPTILSIFRKPITELIKSRVSWRSFRKEKINEGTLTDLKFFLAQVPLTPFGSKPRLAIVDHLFDKNEKIGTYGMVKGAEQFLVGACLKNNNPLFLLDFGFAFEWGILGATDLGLATCWLGATFTKSTFGKAINCTDEEYVPAVSPVGYHTEKRNVIDAVTRFSAGSQRRKPLSEIFTTTSPDGSYEEPYKVALEMLRLAPSASNRQPWRVLRVGDNYHFYLKRTPGYRAMPVADLQMIDIGIGILHFELGALSLGFNGNWLIEPQTVPLQSGQEYICTWRTLAT